MARTQIVKWGNSLAVRIPKPLAEKAGVREGDPVSIDAADGRIQLRRQRQKTPTLRELIAQISPENSYRSLEAGTARGKEKVEW